MEYLVVGQGLAGSLLAWELLQRGSSLCVLDDREQVASTRIAAGVVNPIVGQRLALNWRVTQLLPAARACYASLEEELGVPLFRELPCYRVFANAGEREQWRQRSREPVFREFSTEAEPTGRLGGYVKDPFGGFSIRGAGMLDTAVFLTVMRRRFEAMGCMRSGRFAEDIRDDAAGRFIFQDVVADQVVFCGGHHGRQNPLWQGIPFQTTKGEILMARIPGLPQTLIVGRSVFVLPMGNSLFRVGATYDWSGQGSEITSRARRELESRLQDVLATSFYVIDQQAGIRPSTRRRTPVLGRHPDDPRISVFNGLGSKGVLSAPYFATHLVNHLIDDAPLDSNVDIRTHWKPAA